MIRCLRILRCSRFVVEFQALLEPHFDHVEMLGVAASPEPKAYYDARLARIRRIVRIDPLGLRKILPQSLIESLFAAFAVIVRRGIEKNDGLPEVDLTDFPVIPATDECLDLMALCRGPRPKRSAQ